ncbi:hypothetical protein [Mycobacterium riyadhense]|uniref:Uncharacterized protein n=1 Tax=Mycobacterium riyadhense TaxID=486698 RepID=A0A653F4C2_9MYCO|nr:hypothetical protein [Mycobacterium riyadhense]MCV7146969.1 hypothetical protein [Mycobacterium riyadhense]VTP04490.1 hypothetical protein BIN_B_05560 [Mycobacterium riyadhense]
MRTIQRDGPRRRGGCGCGSHGSVEDTAEARRRALEEHQRDLEQELADVAEQLRDLSTDQPAASE